MKNKALVVLSGGQDSTICLHWAIAKFGIENVQAVQFDYGQRHAYEIDCAKRIAADAGIPLHELPINTFAAIGNSAMLAGGETPAEAGQTPAGQLPATFVPGRNLIFLTFAATLAVKLGIGNIVTGVCQTDYSGYPDCRDSTMEALEHAINHGMFDDPYGDCKIRIRTPLMYLTKAESVVLAQRLPGCMDSLAYSHTCYNGHFPPCGKCDSCVLRAKGFAEAGVTDPLIARARKKGLI